MDDLIAVGLLAEWHNNELICEFGKNRKGMSVCESEHFLRLVGRGELFFCYLEFPPAFRFRP